MVPSGLNHFPASRSFAEPYFGPAQLLRPTFLKTLSVSRIEVCDPKGQPLSWKNGDVMPWSCWSRVKHPRSSLAFLASGLLPCIAGDGWLVRIRLSDSSEVDSLLDAEAYKQLLSEQ